MIEVLLVLLFEEYVEKKRQNSLYYLFCFIYKESAGHLDMMDGLIVHLLNEKWRTFIRFKLVINYHIKLIHCFLFK